MNGRPGEIEFPPAMAVLRTPLIGVMVVVPTFAVAHEADEPVIAAVLVGLVVAIAPDVRQRVDAPGDVPHRDGPDEHAPDEQAPTELRRAGDGAALPVADAEPCAEEQHPTAEVEPHPSELSFQGEVVRIAEHVAGILFIMIQTVDLLVVDQQPAHVSPEQIDQRAMRIRLLVGVLVMQTMDRDPLRRRVLHAQHAERREGSLQPLRHDEALVRQQAVITQVDAERAEDIEPQHGEHDARPTEEVRHEREASDRMKHDERDRVIPDDRLAVDRGRLRQLAVGPQPSMPHGRRTIGGRRAGRYVGGRHIGRR